VLHLSQWPKSVPIHGVEFPVLWADLGDDQGECLWAPDAGAVWIKIHHRFRDTDGEPLAWAWRVLFHEMIHAAWAVSGISEAFGNKKAEESAVVAAEGAWQGLVAVASKRVASRGSKGRTTRTKRRGSYPRPPSRRRSGR
jgi:hypothetical protein